MKIKVLFFAQLRDWFGQDERVVDLEQGSTLDKLTQSLFGIYQENGNLELMGGAWRGAPSARSPQNIYDEHRWGCRATGPVNSRFPFSLRCAVNEELTETSTVLKHGDVVALMTPVSGG